MKRMYVIETRKDERERMRINKWASKPLIKKVNKLRRENIRRVLERYLWELSDLETN